MSRLHAILRAFLCALLLVSTVSPAFAGLFGPDWKDVTKPYAMNRFKDGVITVDALFPEKLIKENKALFLRMNLYDMDAVFAVSINWKNKQKFEPSGNNQQREYLYRIPTDLLQPGENKIRIESSHLNDGMKIQKMTLETEADQVQQAAAQPAAPPAETAAAAQARQPYRPAPLQGTQAAPAAVQTLPAPERVSSSLGNAHALVIGNAGYAASPLANPVNDATDVAAELQTLGFTVTLLTDADKRSMIRAVNRFREDINAADVGFFYYAGHGMQINGRNYLIPVGAKVQIEADVEFESVDVGRVLAQMEEARCKANIVVLDACRDNPFARSFRSNKQGLAKMDSPLGSIIGYATSPGSVAADGAGRNGLYTKYLLQALATPGLDIEDVFKAVRRGVIQETNRRQVPWESSSLIDDVVLHAGSN